MPDPSLTDILDDLRSEGEGFVAAVPETWMQGRTAYGGLTSGLLLGAAKRAFTDLPPIRSALVNFTAPVGDRPWLTARVLRRGRNVTTVAAEARVEEQVVAVATFTFGAARESEVRRDRPAAPAPTPEETEPYIPPAASAMAPGFHRNFDLRLIDGHRPFSGAERGYARIWARHVAENARRGEASVLCLADILPPAVYPALVSRGPNSSMTWICNFLDDDLSSEEGWWQLETDLTAARDGYSSQVMRAWNSRGDLVIDGMQAVAVFV